MTIRVLEAVCRELKDCDAISSTREFCERWLAKDESYLRVLRFHKSAPSVEALTTLSSKLGYYAEHLSSSDLAEHCEWADRFFNLQGLCQEAIERQARARWMSPERMGS